MLENGYQAKLIKKLRKLFPGCEIQKLDSGYQQGIPDLLVLYGPHWAILEVKRKKPTRPEDFEANQEWFIDHFNRMSFSACIYPENEEAVLNDLQQAFRARRSSRLSKS